MRIGVHSIHRKPPRGLLAGMGDLCSSLSCPAGYHGYTPDGVNCICQVDEYTVGEAYSNTVIAAEVNADPNDALAIYERTYGFLPQDVQAELLACKLQQSNAVTFGTPIAANCQGTDAQLIAQFMPTASISPTNAPDVTIVNGVAVPTTYPGVITQPTSGGATPGAGSGSSGSSGGGGTQQSGGSGGTQGRPLSVLLENTSGGSASSFNPGDSFRLTINGPANAPIAATASQNGASPSSSNYGTTDSTGQRIITGTMPASASGTWSETWSVGGAVAGNLSFVVTGPTGAGSGANAGGGSNQSPFAGALSGFQLPAWFTESSIAGIQNWMLVAGGLLAVMILPGLMGRR